jgi:hypothetical protein
VEKSPVFFENSVTEKKFQINNAGAHDSSNVMSDFVSQMGSLSHFKATSMQILMASDINY